MLKFCKKCNLETDRYKSGRCITCSRAAASAWNKANPEKVKVAMATWRKDNPEKGRANHADWYKANQEKRKADASAWRKANPEMVKAYNAAWRKANPEIQKSASAAWSAANPARKKAITADWRVANAGMIKATRAAWVKANPELNRIYCQNRKARKLENGGVLSKGLAAKLLKFQRGLCPCCKQPLGENYHLDHIVPLALGGANEDWNMQLLRQRCNNQKSAMHPVEFMKSRGFLL